MTALAAQANAKINLFLAVGERRADGYHELDTVFHEVGLCDSVSITLHGRGGIKLKSNRGYLPDDSRNLAWKAAALFFDESGVKNPGLYINIKKNIPVGGGMGGGSADAAAVLTMLNRRYGSPLDKQRLMSAALKLGADVPFCVMGGAAHAGGIGELMTAVPPLPRCEIVVCKPNVSVSTKAAYAMVDEWREGREVERVDSGGMRSALECGDLTGICAALYNDFEPPIMDKYPKIARAKAAISALGALGTLMSGSGAAVFGIFAGGGAEAKRELEREFGEVFLTGPA